MKFWIALFATLIGAAFAQEPTLLPRDPPVKDGAKEALRPHSSGIHNIHPRGGPLPTGSCDDPEFAKGREECVRTQVAPPAPSDPPTRRGLKRKLMNKI